MNTIYEFERLPDEVWLISRLPDDLALCLLMFFDWLITNTCPVFMWLQFSQSLLSHSCSYLFSFFVTFPFSLSLLLLLFLPLPHPIRQTQYPSSDPRKHKFQFSLCYWLDKHIVDWEVSVLSSLASKHLGKHNLTCSNPFSRHETRIGILDWEFYPLIPSCQNLSRCLLAFTKEKNIFV